MAAKSHITKLEAMQCIILRIIANVPWYIKNEDLRKDKFSYKFPLYEKKFKVFPNLLANTLYTDNIKRRLKKKHPQDLVTHPLIK